MDILDMAYQAMQKATRAVSVVPRGPKNEEAREIRQALEVLLRELPKDVLPNVVHLIDAQRAKEEDEQRQDGGEKSTSHLFLALRSALPNTLGQLVIELAEAFRKAAREEAEQAVRRRFAASSGIAPNRTQGPDSDGDE